jgi:hypothetical protein
VVGLHTFVVFWKDGVVDGEFGEHWVSHRFGDNQTPPAPAANKDNPPSRED